MTRRNVAGAAVVALVVAVGAWLFFRGSDEDKIREAIARAGGAISTTEDDTNPIMRLARIKGAFKESLEKDARLNVSEVSGVPATLAGIDAIAGAAAQALGMFERASVDVSPLEIKIDDARRSAQVNAKATFTGTERGGRPRVERRDVTFLVLKRDRSWSISTITVWGPRES